LDEIKDRSVANDVRLATAPAGEESFLRFGADVAIQQQRNGFDYAAGDVVEEVLLLRKPELLICTALDGK
jgi:hypothetical protein